MRVLAILTALSLTACGKSEPFTVSTYNAGLAVAFVPAANERAPDTAQAVAALETDLVCLQEVWLPEHVALFDEAAKKAGFEHRYFPDPQQEDMPSPACAAGELDDLITCMDVDCGSVCDDELVDCLFASCPLEFLTLGKTCNRCVQAHVGTATPAEVADECNNGGIEYAYGGSFGTGILSKYPFEVEEIVLASTTNRRGLLHATVEGPEGPIDTYCTHLTAGLSLIPYPRDEGSWESEQGDQVALLAGLLADAPDPVMVLGDLNNGPATNDADAEFEAHFQMLLDEGMKAPYVDLDGSCTFCPENALSSVDSSETGELIDHILIRGFDPEAELSVRRDLDQALTVTSCEAPLDGAHSDHYGISVTMTP